MTDTVDPLRKLWIIGAGAVGTALATLLRAHRDEGSIIVSGRGESAPSPPPTAVVLAVPDRAIPEIASRLAASELSPMPVLHTSGALGQEPLIELANAGWSTGSLHPLVAVPRASGGPSPLQGAWFALQADGPARRVGEAIVQAAGGHLIELSRDGKPLYHAAAVFASNYLVALMSVAERLAAAAGADPADAREALASLAGGALASVRELGPEEALTGPIARGDVATVELHLSRLSGPDRSLYSRLARAALDLSSSRLEAEAVARLEAILGDEE